ncbi:hypothetical protein [Actinopolyspora alba]|uniref:hypothetical protein n=1 Tax=Actinopolyspora alba TaxID=673379 RepID=UPI0011143B11|nr:hypothetical protein [Actinopolyspora alba]
MDLRTQSLAELIVCAERALGTQLMQERAVCKRRSLGLPSGRDTWVRISVSPAEAAAERGGLEATTALPSACRHPQWHQGACWHDGELLWRVEETELVTEPVICSGGMLATEPELGQGWWQHLAKSP